jgi:hypothetical protein
MTVTPEYMRERYWHLKGLGICAKCGQEDRIEGRAYGAACLDRNRMPSQVTRDRKRAEEKRNEDHMD